MKKKSETATPAEMVLLADLPDAPDEFRLDRFSDPGGPWIRGLAEVDADHADRSGPDKAIRAVRPLAWAVHLIGGSTHGDRQRLTAAQVRVTEIVSRVAALEHEGKDKTQAERELAAADREVARLAPLVEAVRQWAGPDNVTLRARLDEAQLRYEEMFARITPYRQAHLPIPDPSWETDLYDSEKALMVAKAGWIEGVTRLDKLSHLLREATARAYQSLLPCLAHVCDRLGVEAHRIVNANDPEFLIAFPSRAPDSLLPLFDRAVRLNQIMYDLDPSKPDAGLARFEKAAGEVAAEIVRERAGLAPSIPVFEITRRESVSPDAIMGEKF